MYHLLCYWRAVPFDCRTPVCFMQVQRYVANVFLHIINRIFSNMLTHAVSILCVAESTRNSCCRGRVRAQADDRYLSELDTWVTRFKTQTISCEVCSGQCSWDRLVIRDSETGLSSVTLRQACHPWLWVRLVIRDSETGLSSVTLRQACHPWLWDRLVIRLFYVPPVNAIQHCSILIHSSPTLHKFTIRQCRQMKYFSLSEFMYQMLGTS
jgi:hypothetical protein